MIHSLTTSTTPLIFQPMSSLDLPASINTLCEQSHLFAFNQFCPSLSLVYVQEKKRENSNIIDLNCTMTNIEEACFY